MPCSQFAKQTTTSLLCLLFLGFAACNNGGDNRPVVEFSNFDGGTVGCSQPSFPSDQPDLSFVQRPIFLLTTSGAQASQVGQAQVRPGDDVEAEVTVNSATQRLIVELANVSSPDNVVFTDEIATRGNETLSVVMPTESNTRGRFYMRLTLCAADCDEEAILFAVRECTQDPEDTEPCRDNAPYQRSILEQGVVTQTDATCIGLRGEPGVGSGTVLIQP